MKKHWENIYLALSRYRDKFNPKKEDINNKYNLLINELRVQEENELKVLSNKINKEVNPNNLDIFMSGQTLHYNLGLEIGFVIKLKLKTNLKEIPKDINEYIKIKDDFIFTYTMVDRDGIFMFISDDWEGWLEATHILAYFDVIVIHSNTNQ
jgi:hypothetical protein